MYIPAIPSLRWAKIAVILSLVSITLLLLKYSYISFYQSSNFIQSLLDYPEFSTIFFGMTTCMFLFAGAGAVDISVSTCSLKASFVICKNPSHYDNTSILFVLLELILVLFHSSYYMYFVWQVTLPSFFCGFCLLHLSYKVSLLMLYQMLWSLLLELRLYLDKDLRWKERWCISGKA